MLRLLSLLKEYKVNELNGYNWILIVVTGIPSNFIDLDIVHYDFKSSF